MNEKELWEYFLQRKVYLSSPLQRKLIWITREDFEPVKEYFVQDFNPLHPGRSFRTRGHLSHIHVIEQGEYVHAHHDIANVSRFFPLAIIHFLFDVLPYVILAWVKRVSFHSLFMPPSK